MATPTPAEQHIITTDRKGEFLKAVLEELRRAGDDGARARDLLDAAAPRLDLTDWELSVTDKQSNVRWEAVVHLYSIDLGKAGWITKGGGRWFLTPEGEDALQQYPASQLIREAMKLYREWKRQRDSGVSKDVAPEDVEDLAEAEEQVERAARQQAYERAVTLAREGIEDHIRSLGPYALQDLVAELLRGMGYHVRDIAPKGRDGGVDIVAYQDPLGTRSPRVQVQVKHTTSKVGPEPVRALAGVITTEGDMGLLVATGGFSPDAKQAARQSHRHVELIDLDRFLTLWDQHYDSIGTPGTSMLPLVRVPFLAPDEA